MALCWVLRGIMSIQNSSLLQGDMNFFVSCKVILYTMRWHKQIHLATHHFTFWQFASQNGCRCWRESRQALMWPELYKTWPHVKICKESYQKILKSCNITVLAILQFFVHQTDLIFSYNNKDNHEDVSESHAEWVTCFSFSHSWDHISWNKKE